MKFLDPAVLAKLSNLRVRSRCVVEGMLSGLHSSPYRGHSLEFAQHREYSHGDELRHIDWKVLGRSDKFFVKQYQDETNLRAAVLLDASHSMSFTSGGRLSKLAYGTTLASALAYLLLKQDDAVGTGVFDERLRFYIPPRTSLSHLGLIIDRLETVQSSGETKLEAVLRDFGRSLKKRSLVIVISDFLYDQEETFRALKSLRFRHHGVMAIQVLDPDEIRCPYHGEHTFVDLEDQSTLVADADTLAAQYEQVMEQFLETYKRGFRSADIEYTLLTTAMPFEVALGTCLTKG